MNNDNALTPTFITPSGYACGMEGVWLTESYGRDVPREQILDLPLWLSEILSSAETGEHYAVIGWIDRWKGHRTDLMPLYSSSKSIVRWLARHGILGFDVRRPSKISNYLTACIRVWQETHEPKRITNMRSYVNTIRK